MKTRYATGADSAKPRVQSLANSDDDDDDDEPSCENHHEEAKAAVAMVISEGGESPVSSGELPGMVAVDMPRSYAEMEGMFRTRYDRHFTALMTQLIKAYGLSLSWLDVIRPLITKATQSVRTDVFPEDIMDINEYIRVKKLPCGLRSDSSLNHGVVCSKNVTHKKMCTNIVNPTILLLKCAFDFQRRENQFSSFDTLHLQENKYLQNLVDKVKAFRPKIILVQKSVSRLALEDLYNLNIVVVVNMKQTVMERVARCTQGEILTSLDQLFFDVRLGTCGNFYLRNFTLETGVKKTLMYFDNCDPKLGCVLTLQGSSNKELKKVKRVTQFGLHLAYNSLLESSFLLDEYAWLDNGAEQDMSRSPDPYSSTSTTPEFPLYPSLPHPLDALPPAEILKRLEALELDGGDSADEATLEKGGEESMSGSNKIESRDPIDAEGVASGCGQTSEAAETTAETITLTEKLQGGGLEPKSSQSDTYSADSAGISAESHSQTDVSSQVDSSSTSASDPAKRLSAVKQDVLADLGRREFEAAISNQLLSISPNVVFTVPYLQTTQGSAADIRQYLPSMIYWSYQFRPVSPRCGRAAKTTDAVEMGLTRDLVEQVAPIHHHKSSGALSLSRSRSHTSYHAPSYKSVSEHPFTTSFLLLKANTNEMRAALADFRSRAGLATEDNNFFFKSAKVAVNYRLHLQNVFNRFKENEGEGEGEGEEEEPVEGMGDQGVSCVVVGNGVGDNVETQHAVTTPQLPTDVNGGVASVGVAKEDGPPQSTEARRGTGSFVGGTTGTVTTSHESSPLKDEVRGKSRSGSCKVRTGTLEDMDRGVRGVSEEYDKGCGLGSGCDDIWLGNELQADCLDPIKHQGISVLFSNTCKDRQKNQLRPCLPPW